MYLLPLWVQFRRQQQDRVEFPQERDARQDAFEQSHDSHPVDPFTAHGSSIGGLKTDCNIFIAFAVKKFYA